MTVRVGDGAGFVLAGDEAVHEWAMFRLVRRSVVAPDGTGFERSFLASPGAVAVVAVSEEHEVVLVSQFRAALGRHVTEIPAGMRDVPGEDPLETARRELREEAGFVATDWTFVGAVHSAPGITDSEVVLYLARGLSMSPADPHGPEELHMSVDLVPLGRAVEAVWEGSITDAKTVFGLLAAERILGRVS